MKKALKFLLLLPATAYTEPFTILAKSGLNVRKAPSATSEKVASLPFGTVVDADIDYETDIGHNGRYIHVSEVIEGKQGFWMRISYGKVEGYPDKPIRKVANEISCNCITYTRNPEECEKNVTLQDDRA